MNRLTQIVCTSIAAAFIGGCGDVPEVVISPTDDGTSVDGGAGNAGNGGYGNSGNGGSGNAGNGGYGNSGNGGSGNAGNGGYGNSGNGGSGNAGNGGSGAGGAGCGDDLTGKFTTYTQGAWHNDNNTAGSLLYANIDSLAPNGVRIGLESADYALFKNTHCKTTAEAINAFLPQGGTEGTLDGKYTNPWTTPAGVLGGQALTLKLNILFSAMLDNACGYGLGELVVADQDDVCAGMSVEDIITAADGALSGTSSAFTPYDINKCVSAVNENFDNGNADKGYLRIP